MCVWRLQAEEHYKDLPPERKQQDKELESVASRLAIDTCLQAKTFFCICACGVCVISVTSNIATCDFVELSGRGNDERPQESGRRHDADENH